VVWNSVVERIEGDGAVVTHLALRHVTAGAASQLPVGGVFVFVGFKPNTGVVQGHVQHDAAGYLVTDTYMMSSIPGLFAAGDVRSQLTRQVTTAVGDGTTAAIAVAKYVAEHKTPAAVG